jgi:hypothetical protein
MFAAVVINSGCRVTATAVGLSGVSRSAFSHRNPGASSSCPRITPPANHPVPGLPLSAVFHFCTFARGSSAFAPLHCLLSSCPQVLKSLVCPQPNIRFPHAAPFASCIFPLPTCQRVNLPTSCPLWPTGQLVNRSTDVCGATRQAHSPVTIFNRYCALFQSPTIWA